MINEYENTLRTIILNILGDDPTIYGVSNERIDKWRAKKDEEFKKRNGLLTETRLIYYSDFYDLKNIVAKNWEKHFKEVFLDKRRFEVLYEEMEVFRNNVAHGRPLLSHQESFLKAITEDLKLKIVQYHNKNMGAEDYFIKILKVTDSLGNTWEEPRLGLITQSTLRVGDTLELIVDAYDPKGGEIEYKIKCNKGGESYSSTDGKILLPITDSMIAKRASFSLTVSVPESKYENKAQIPCHYIILPKE